MGNVKILKASAGSGKTYRLAYEYIRNVIETPWLYRNILAVTFTNKATEEMKERIISEINALANGAPTLYFRDLERDLSLSAGVIQSRAAEARTKILHDYSHFAVVTIDKFFQRIIRSFIKELGIDLNFTLELQTDTILESATESLIDDIAVDAKLKNWVMRFVEERLEDNKKWDVRAQISELGREIFREHFGATTLNSNSKDELEAIVNESIEQSLRVKREMKDIADRALLLVSEAGVGVDDFAYGRGGCMSYFLKVQQGVIEPYGKRVADAMLSADKWVSKSSPRRLDIEPLVVRLQPMLMDLCSRFDSNIRFIKSSSLLQENFRSFALLTDLSERIAKICAEQNIMPISETNNILNRLISGNDTPFIYEKVGNSFSHFMIDEFQDTSAQQWANFVPLLHNALAQSSKSPVLLVGDVKQSIYRWRGGDWQILGGDVERQFDEISIDTLDTNYRSEGVVVGFNNNVIEVAVGADNRLLNELLDDASERGVISKASCVELTDMLSRAYMDHAQICSKSLSAGYVRITEVVKTEAIEAVATPAASSQAAPLQPMSAAPSQAASSQPMSAAPSQAAFVSAESPQPTPPSPVISTIEELQRRGYAPGDIAILVRYNREGSLLASQLLDYKSLHPESPYCYDLVTQEALVIGNSDVVGFIIALFKLSVNVVDGINRAIFNRYLKRNVDDAILPSEQTFIASLRLCSLDEAFENVIIEYQLNLNSKNIAYIQALQEQVHSFSNSHISDVPLFVKWWEQTGAKRSINLPRNSDAITIISIHKAKGLQYRAVVVPFCDWDLQPKTGQMLWANSTNGVDVTTPFDRLGAVPIQLKKDMADSFFAEEYFREVVLSHIDNINTFYVAATRAKEELHIMVPKGGGRRSSIGALLLGSMVHGGAMASESLRISGTSECSELPVADGMVNSGGSRYSGGVEVPASQSIPSASTIGVQAATAECQRVGLGTMSGRLKEGANGRVFEFGEEHRFEPKPRGVAANIDYPTRKIGSRLRFSFNSDRYFVDEPNVALSPRSYGVIMHKVFEHIEELSQVDQRLKDFRAEGIISDDDFERVSELIVRSLEDPLVRSWFDPKWDLVRNESAIITPGESVMSRRPDRVVTKGVEAVVVDYKFGSLHRSSHIKQMREYMDLLRRMGYRCVKGYIWYVEQQDVLEVTAEDDVTEKSSPNQ